jgi:hypothetical protein
MVSYFPDDMVDVKAGGSPRGTFGDMRPMRG